MNDSDDAIVQRADNRPKKPDEVEVCKYCGKPINGKALSFCPNCGNKRSTNAETSGLFCKWCGSKLVAGAPFCPSCGKHADDNGYPNPTQSPLQYRDSHSTNNNKPIIVIGIILIVLFLAYIVFQAEANEWFRG